MLPAHAAPEVWAEAALAVARKKLPLASPAQLYELARQLIRNRAPENERVEATSLLYESLFPGLRADR